MGMFTQKPEEPSEWVALPGELFDRDEADLLPEQPSADPFGLGLGAPTSAASVAIPLPPAEPGTAVGGSGADPETEPTR